MIINKPYTNKEYADLAVYCNRNNCHIEDKGNYLESVINTEPEKTEEMVRSVRNRYLEETDKYMLPDFPIDHILKDKYKYYRQYLRNYTEQPEWWKEYPKTFDEWSK